jgi:hypothetical protein
MIFNKKDIICKLEKLRIFYTENHVHTLLEDIHKLRQFDLAIITKRLFEQEKPMGFRDALTEHNFAVDIINNHSSSNLKILYEPQNPTSTNNRPPDLKIEFNGIEFWIQIKRKSLPERTNRQNRVIKEIKEKTKLNALPKFFSVLLSENFPESQVDSLIEFIFETSQLSAKASYCSLNSLAKAEIDFWNPQNVTLKNLTMGYSGDLSAVNETGQEKNQFRKAFLNAAGAIQWDSTCNVLNLIMIESCFGDCGESIDIAEALYGTETFNTAYNVDEEKFSYYNSREKDGLFSDENFSKNITGIIVRKKNSDELHPMYTQILCINEAHLNHSNIICSFFRIEKLFRYNELPRQTFFNI